MEQKKILITCFKPFHKRKENSSEIILNMLLLPLKREFNNVVVDSVSLVVDKLFSMSRNEVDKLKEVLDKKYDFVLSMGEELTYFKARFEKIDYYNQLNMYYVDDIIINKSYFKINNKKRRWNSSPCNRVQNILFDYSLTHQYETKWEFIHWPKIGFRQNSQQYIEELMLLFRHVLQK